MIGPKRRGLSGYQGAFSRLSSRSFNRFVFIGISFRAPRRTKSGTSSLPIPWPSKSSAIVTRDRVLPLRGSTVTCTIALIGPSIPRMAQLLGGLIAVISGVIFRSAKPMRRVVMHFAPTREG
jgi:hypothetical protein